MLVKTAKSGRGDTYLSRFTRIVLTTANLDPNHRVRGHSDVSSTDLDGMEIEVAGQTVFILIALWLSLQLPLGLVTARALARANPRN
jgi:hypothetical protein